MCRQHLADLCGAAKPGADCRNCTASHPELNPNNSNSPYFCESWDIDAFCRSAGALAAALAPVQQEESLEPVNAVEFVLDSFAVCREYGFAIGPAYILLLRAGFTAMFLAWLSILPQPIGSGEPSVPGALAVVVGVLLVGKSLLASCDILLLESGPAFVDSWYLGYEIRWWVALQHPSFGQACSVVLHKFFGWISTELAWRRKAAEWEYRNKQKKAEEEKARRKAEEAAKKKAAPKPAAKGAAPKPAAKAQRIAQSLDSAAARMRENIEKIAQRDADPEELVAKSDELEQAAENFSSQAAVAAGRRPPQPPGRDAAAALFKTAELLKPPPEAALGKWATVALQVSLVLALLNMILIAGPLTFTHLIPSIILLPPTIMVGIIKLGWWRALGLQAVDCVLAGLFIAVAGWLMAFLKQEAMIMAGEELADESWVTKKKKDVLAEQLGLTLHPRHPRMFAARAVFVKGLSLLAALIVIILQEATTRIILFRQRDAARLYAITATMLAVWVAAVRCGDCGTGQEKAVLLLCALASVCCAYLLNPLQLDPAEIFDARGTCAYAECALHHFDLGVLGTINNYFELGPFVTAVVHSVSPVKCYYTLDYKPPHWGQVGLVLLALMLLAAIGYFARKAALHGSQQADDEGLLRALLQAEAGPGATAPAVDGSPSQMIKVLLLGESWVGKSQLMNRFTVGEFDPRSIGTVGVDFKVKTLEVGGQAVKLQIWDTAGKERFRTMTKAYFRGAAGVAIVYDASESGSANSVNEWLEMVRQESGDGVCGIIVGNKSDLTSGTATELADAEKAKRLAEEHGFAWIETSAKDGANVDQMFTTLVEAILAKRTQ